MKIPKRRFIRRGQKHFYRKGSQSEIDQRRGYVARMLAAGKTKTQIHRAVREKFKICWRQTDRYLAFVSGSCKVKTTRLPRARAECSQSMLSEMNAKLRFICADTAK